MTQIIHFRSKQNQRHLWIGSQKKMRSRWSEYDTLRPATPYDDARDIAWKQSAKSESLFIKSREDTLNIAIRLIGVYDASWDFCLEYGDEKAKFYGKIDHACRYTSSHFQHIYNEHMYTSMSIDWVSALLQKKRIEKEVIIIITSNLTYTQYEWLTLLKKHNDVICIHLLHPFESNPDIYENTLCESSLIQKIAYKKELNKAQWEISSYLSKNNIGYIAAVSTDNPVDLLNYFFKYRYAR